MGRVPTGRHGGSTTVYGQRAAVEEGHELQQGHQVQRPRAWATTGVYRELARRVARCGGSRRRLLALVERRRRGMGEFGAMREDAATFAGWRGPLAPS